MCTFSEPRAKCWVPFNSLFKIWHLITSLWLFLKIETGPHSRCLGWWNLSSVAQQALRGTGNTASLALCPPPQNSCNPPPGLRTLGDTRPWAPALLTHFPDNICNKKSKQRPLTTAKAKTNLENRVMIAQSDSTYIIGVDWSVHLAQGMVLGDALGFPGLLQ